jgi:hypothetical protein
VSLNYCHQTCQDQKSLQVSEYYSRIDLDFFWTTITGNAMLFTVVTSIPLFSFCYKYLNFFYIIMMKHFVILSTVLMMSIIVGPLDHHTSVSASYILLRFIFNNGRESTGTTFCTEQDHATIDRIFVAVARRKQRNLRGDQSLNGTVAAATDDDDDDDEGTDPTSTKSNYNETTTPVVSSIDINGTTSIATGREMFPAICEDACAGYVPRTCRAGKCKGYRRQNRDLQFTSTFNRIMCPSLLDMYQRRLDDLIRYNQVSDTCKNFIVRSRRLTFCTFC